MLVQPDLGQSDGAGTDRGETQPGQAGDGQPGPSETCVVQPGPGVIANHQRSGGIKIVFANQLRALAALSVVASHLAGLFILMGPLVGWITSTPEVHVGRPAILRLTLLPWFNYGAFGVAVFFLISGFVIPFSLRAQGSGAFLVARVFRIYPLLWGALLLEWLAVFGSQHLYGRPMAFGVWTYLANALLLDTLLGSGYVDLVNWTLAVEIKFYLLMALMRPAILGGRVWPLFGWSVFAIGLAMAQQHGTIHLSTALADEPMCIGFMLIGTVFHYHLAGQLGAMRALAAGSVLAGLFVLCWRVGPIQDQFPRITLDYGYALGLFFAAYLLRDWFRPIRLLDGLADISYPLYLVHSVIGYSVMSFTIIRFGFSYDEALPTGLAAVLLLAWALHRTVERPSLRLGKRLAGALRQNRTSGA